ncbi:family 78 glycoside hydrolase catalytic domain [Paenibacillus sp.]|uniref:family 78 glycoside hydrolase catalytic domain n=1 Tax=Paenibacillus sp. TaxID=58172 RepID=UPI002D3A4B67|nr:alpha-L-rhamnosidase N-terminal domain-containing protein [Paenibacillus sp.]HZG88175.1 alpha-L-rhamnosidase N-terminal domain-containing protein [Paenibacillus sp.]
MGNRWQAQWIWAAHDGPPHNIYVEARKTFTLADGSWRSAAIRVSANQEYILYVNGTEIGRGPSPSDNAWKYYDSYDIAPLLRPGSNTIALLAYNFGDQAIVTQQLQGPGGLIAEADISAAGGERIVVGTDGSWKARRSRRWVESVSRLHLWGGFREMYLAEREDGWERPEYDDGHWPDAVVVSAACDPAGPWPRLLPRDIPFLSRERHAPQLIAGSEPFGGRIERADALLADASPHGTGGGMTLDASRPGSFPAVTFDFGKQRVGYMELEVTAPEGGVLQLHYGESLDMALHDTFFLKRGANTLRPFGRRAFRYVKTVAQATPAPVVVERFGVQSVGYPFVRSGAFRCDDELLNRIWETGRYTTMLNSQDHLEDCPLREKALWVVDAIVMGKVIYQTFGDTALLRKCLLQGARIQNEDGSIPGTGPERNTFLLPDFCAHWLSGVADYWRYAADEAFLRDVWPAALRLIDWFEAQEDENGIFSGADRDGWWCFIDWSDDLDKRDQVAAVSCLQHKMYADAAELAEALGDRAYAERCRRKAGTLRESIRARFRHPERDALADCRTKDGLSDSVTAQTNFMAIWTGVTTADEAVRFLTDTYLADRCPPIKGAFFYHIVLETLFDYGFVDAALERIRSFWGEMLRRGATTWWETFDPATPHSAIPSPYQGNTPTYLADHIPVSHCHGWGASPTYLLTQRVLGIDASRLCTGTLAFVPQPPSGMAWAEGAVPTPWGDVAARWERKADGAVVFEAELPASLEWGSPILRQPSTTIASKDRIRVRGLVPADDAAPLGAGTAAEASP